jgi:predicted aspartyl protease
LQSNSEKEKTTQNLSSNVNVALIGDRSGSHTPPFILTFEIFNRNVHNCLVDSGASSNVMPYSVCKKLNIEPKKSSIQIVQLDRSNVKVLGELKNVLIRLSLNPKVHQTIDIIVVDILNHMV